MPARYTCPICEYPELERPPVDFEICPACGIEFDYEDSAPTPEAKAERQRVLRQRWLQSGAEWFDWLRAMCGT